MPSPERKKQTLILIRKLNGNERPMVEADTEKAMQNIGDAEMDTPAPKAETRLGEHDAFSKRALGWIRENFGPKKPNDKEQP